jgi:hypothetical protein
LVLVVSTLFVHIGGAVPTIGLLVVVAFAAVFPVFYELMLNSEELNERSPDRPARVLTAIGLRALALTLLAALVVVDVDAVRGSGTPDIGLIFFGIPLAVTMTAAAISLMPRPETEVESEVATRERVRRVGGGLAVGAAVVGLLAVGGWLLQPVVGGLYPAPSERLVTMNARAKQVQTEVVTIFNGDSAALPASATAVWEREVDWLAQNPPPGCAIAVWRSWRDVLDDYFLWGVLVDGATHPSPTRTQAEVDLVTQSITDWPTKLQSHLNDFGTATDKALTECSST